LLLRPPGAVFGGVPTPGCVALRASSPEVIFVWRFAPKNRSKKCWQDLNESSQKPKQCQRNFTEIQLSENMVDASGCILSADFQD
jgi:hypothetical protein